MTIMPVAVQLVGEEYAGDLRSLKDGSLKKQVERCLSRPLNTDEENFVKFSSWKGRLVCAKEFLYTSVRELYREGKNALLTAEKTASFIRIFLQTLFREEGFTWKQLGERGKEVGSSFLALFVRPVTYGLDLAKLAIGVIIHPAAAISLNKPKPEEPPEVETETPEIAVEELS